MAAQLGRKVDELSINELEKVINEREARIDTYMEFSDLVTFKLGEQVERDVMSSRIYTKHILRDLNGFAFVYEDGSGGYGEVSEAQISYLGLGKVFHVEFDSVQSKRTVYTYNVGEWENTLDEMVRRKDALVEEVIAERKTNRKTEYDRTYKEQKEEQQKRMLVERAKSLGL